jgi:hypothetical protein
MSEWEGKPLSAADSWAGLQVKEQLLALAADAAVAAWDQGSPAAALGKCSASTTMATLAGGRIMASDASLEQGAPRC